MASAAPGSSSGRQRLRCARSGTAAWPVLALMVIAATCCAGGDTEWTVAAVIDGRGDLLADATEHVQAFLGAADVFTGAVELIRDSGVAERWRLGCDGPGGKVSVAGDLQEHLESFLRSVCGASAGRNVLVVVMSHGLPPRAGPNGALQAVLQSEPGRGMSARELGQCIRKAVPDRSRRTVTVVLETCYGALLDTADDMAAAADWLLASPGTVDSPGYPWPKILDALATSDPGDAKDFARGLQCALAGEAELGAATLVNLCGMGGLRSALTQISRAALTDLDSAAAAGMWLRSRPPGDVWDREVCDALSLCDALDAYARTGALHAACGRFREALGSVVVARFGRASGEDSSWNTAGVTLFLPGGLSQMATGYARTSTLARETGYGEFVMAYQAYCSSLVPGLGF